MKKILSIIAIAAALTACSEKDSPEEVVDYGGSVILSEKTVSAGPEGGNYSVKVTSDGDWRVSGFCDWVSLSAEQGKSGQDLTLTVAPNNSDEARVANFKVFAGSAVESLMVVSLPSFSLELLSNDAVSVSADANQVKVVLKTNVTELNCDFGGAAWIAKADEVEALGRRVLSFDVARSREFKARESTISITGEGQTATVSLTQAQRDTAFAVEGTSIIKGLEAMDITLTIKSNVDITYSLPSWLSKTSEEDTEMDQETGLKTKTLGLHADACGGSRAVDLQFKQGSTVRGSVYIKQQNPNPVFAEIKDSQLVTKLQNDGWILYDSTTGKSEILEAGMNATSITVGTMSNSYSVNSIASIEGLEAFPALATLNVGFCMVDKVDVSKYPALTSVTLLSLGYLTEVNLGDKEIEKLSCKTTGYGYHRVESVTFKGSKVKEIDFSGSSSYIGYGYETALKTVDVTACPALEKLNTKRVGSSSYYSGQTSLETIYVTSAQAESVQVTKNDHTQVVVK